MNWLKYLMLLILAPACQAQTAGDISRKALPVAPTLRAATLTFEEETAHPRTVQERPLPLATLREHIQQFETAIAELRRGERQDDAGLIEQYAALGDLYFAAGQYDKARAQFRNVLYRTRINHGLETLLQLAALERLIATNARLGDWEELDRNYHYLYWVHKRNFKDGDTRLLPVLDRLGRWQLRAYHMRLGGRTFTHLLEASKTYNSAMKVLSSAQSVDRDAFADIVYGSVLWNYYVAAHAAGSEELDGVGIPSFDPTTNRLAQLVAEEALRQQMVEDRYRTGKYILERLIETYSELGRTHDQAGALTHLGDWQLLFHRYTSAREYYQRAYHLLLTKGAAEAGEFFENPCLLPAMDLLRKPEPRSADRAPYLRVELDINGSGMVRDVELLEVGPEPGSLPKRQVIQALKTLRHARFRPKFVAGSPADTSDFHLKLVFYDAERG